VIGDAAQSRTTWSGGPHSHSEDHLILNRLGDEPPQRIVAVPLVVRERTVAVLYADSAALDSEAINLEALETLVRVASMAVELLAARTAPTKRVAESASQPAETAAEEYAPAAYVPAREYGESGQQQVSESPDQSPAAASEIGETSQAPAVAAEYRHSEQSSMIDSYQQAESSPAGDSYQPVSSTPQSDAEPSTTQAGARRRYGMDLELPIEVSGDEERRLHSDARRFARLLVSEIKLYNEQKVAEGRSQHDLYDRLREYIDRSREMYDKRVKPEVAKKYDYFHHELVSTLAEGDAEKLGDSYPGATVPAPLSS
jgi:hypothetical protein